MFQLLLETAVDELKRNLNYLKTRTEWTADDGTQIQVAAEQDQFNYNVIRNGSVIGRGMAKQRNAAIHAAAAIYAATK